MDNTANRLIMKIDHLAIWVEDLEEMSMFYMTYFSMTRSKIYINEKKQYASYFLSFPDSETRIELMHCPDIASQSQETKYLLKGLAHFAISVGSINAVNTLTNHLRTDNYKIASEPRTTGDGYYESQVLDPEGNLIEITE